MKYEITLIEILLELFEKSDEDKNVSITLPYTDIEKCFILLNEAYKEIPAYLISQDLFELIKHSGEFEYYEELQHKSVDGRRFTLYGRFLGSVVIVDTSLKNHNYIWFVNRKQTSTPNIYIKHKLIIS